MHGCVPASACLVAVFLLAMHAPMLVTAAEPEIFAFNTDVNCNHAANGCSRLNIT